MKKCFKCGAEKPLGDFYKHKKMADGHLNKCKECTKKDTQDNPKCFSNKTNDCYDYTEKGVIRVMYKTQKANSKRRKLEMPTYSKDELSDWLYDNGFKDLYSNWVLSGHQKNYKPSVDRLSDCKRYSFANIQLGTWKENKDKQTEDVLLGRSTSGEKCKKVLQYSKNGDLLAEFVSCSAAGRSTGLDFRGISKVCLGKQKTCGGFKFKYSCDVKGET